MFRNLPRKPFTQNEFKRDTLSSSSLQVKAPIFSVQKRLFSQAHTEAEKVLKSEKLNSLDKLPKFSPFPSRNNKKPDVVSVDLTSNELSNVDLAENLKKLTQEVVEQNKELLSSNLAVNANLLKANATLTEMLAVLKTFSDNNKFGLKAENEGLEEIIKGLRNLAQIDQGHLEKLEQKLDQASNNRLSNLAAYATILSVIIALLIFTYENQNQKNKEDQNKLEKLKALEVKISTNLTEIEVMEKQAILWKTQELDAKEDLKLYRDELETLLKQREKSSSWVPFFSGKTNMLDQNIRTISQKISEKEKEIRLLEHKQEVNVKVASNRAKTTEQLNAEKGQTIIELGTIASSDEGLSAFLRP